jgi:hypothetical protein
LENDSGLKFAVPVAREDVAMRLVGRTKSIPTGQRSLIITGEDSSPAFEPKYATMTLYAWRDPRHDQLLILWIKPDLITLKYNRPIRHHNRTVQHNGWISFAKEVVNHFIVIRLH